MSTPIQPRPRGDNAPNASGRRRSPRSVRAAETTSSDAATETACEVLGEGSSEAHLVVAGVVVGASVGEASGISPSLCRGASLEVTAVGATVVVDPVGADAIVVVGRVVETVVVGAPAGSIVVDGGGGSGAVTVNVSGR